VHVVSLQRLPDEVRSPSRPLNAGVRFAVEATGDPGRTWVFRLDSDDFLASDDVLAAQLEAGGHRELIMATLVFFEPAIGGAIDYGPRPRHRTLAGLPGRDVYAVAHHATAMRVDLLRAVCPQGPLYDPVLETGEDLGVTCRLVAALGRDDHRFAFVENPYCYKELADETITGSLPLRRVLRSHRKLLRDHRNLSRFIIYRGLAELALGRVLGEKPARVLLQHVAGRNGHYRNVEYGLVQRRITELVT
jgi:hypothetical protein